MNKIITSTQNPLIKSLLILREKSRERKKQELFIIEGEREISMCLRSGHTLITLLHCPDIFSEARFGQFATEIPESCNIVEVSRDVFNRLAYRKESGGLIASAHPEKKTLSDLELPENPLILVLESVEKPGNLGAILRTADAAGISAIIICDPLTDLYNPNTIRASLGAVFSSQLVVASSANTINWLKERQIKSFGTAITGQHFYHEVDLSLPAAIIMGAEATGLSGLWLSEADELIRIPMQGKVDSLNVSTSAAIVVFEAMRQRKFR